ncbi:hypothetical protein MWG46_00180 [Escherichia coli]|nr:hypothetical protein [Escherichia coli]
METEDDISPQVKQADRQISSNRRKTRQTKSKKETGKKQERDMGTQGEGEERRGRAQEVSSTIRREGEEKGEQQTGGEAGGRQGSQEKRSSEAESRREDGCERGHKQ